VKSKSTSQALAELFGAAEKEAAPLPVVETSPAPTRVVAAPTKTDVRRRWRAMGDLNQQVKRHAHRGIDAMGIRYGWPGHGVLDKAGWKVLADRMAVGRWYRLVDLIGLMPEYARDSVSVFERRARLGGLVERGLAPEGHQGAFGFRRWYLYRRVG